MKICPDGAPDCQGPPNGGIAAPVLDSVSKSGPQLNLQGHLQGKARSRFIVELFANQRPGSVEGETFLADVVTTTDDGGHAKFSAVVDGSVPGGMPSNFTATTTSSDGATSELSQPVARPR